MSNKKLIVMLGYAIFGASCATEATEAGGEQGEIIDNLVAAGFPRNDIQVEGGKVYVGRDAEVSLQASREMLQVDPAEGGKEQYRTTNLVSRALTSICLRGHAGPQFPAAQVNVLAQGLNLAIENYNQLGLVFTMRAIADTDPGVGCGAIIEANVIDGNGGVAGFPANGLPFGAINIGIGVANFGLDVAEHVITHEIGHTLGFRHTDFFNRTISCGQGGNEGDAGVGAIHIPGTPTGAVVGGSVMNACFRTTETGEFTADDAFSLRLGYGR